MIKLARASDPVLLELLQRHPRVERVEERAAEGLEFHQGDWVRSIVQGDATASLFGLVELMDNNPLVCAERVSIPTPLGVLAAIALGPLIDAGLLLEAPTILASCEQTEDSGTDQLLARMGWTEGAVVHATPLDFQTVLAATVIAAVSTPDRIEDLDDFYQERFGRSFFVRRHEEGDWDISSVKGTPYALYRMRIAHDIPTSLLTIQVMADAEGKCGAGALMHGMNVMAGFEESLGLS